MSVEGLCDASEGWWQFLRGKFDTRKEDDVYSRFILIDVHDVNHRFKNEEQSNFDTKKQ